MLELSANDIWVIKLILLLIGLIYFVYMFGIREKKSKDRGYIVIYGRWKSVQFIPSFLIISILFISLLIDIVSYLFFSTSIIQYLLGDLFKLSDEVIGIYLSSLITVTIGFVGIIGIIVSILYGSYHIFYSSKSDVNIPERIKTEKQGRVWLGILSYFIIVTFFIFIYPLIIQLGS